MDKKENIQFPTYSEIEKASKDYSSYETKNIYKDSEIKKLEIERNFTFAVKWVMEYLKTKNTC